jgi:hypothetical protein
VSTNTDSPVSLFTSFVDFLGSANVQKVIGLAGGATLSTDVHTFWAKLSTISVGAAFALAVHGFDAVRAKIGR